MTAPAAKIALFAVALLAVFGVGVALGAWFDASPPGGVDADKEMGAHEEPGAHGAGHAGGAVGEAVRGLGSAENGLRLVVADPRRRPGEAGLLRFRVAGADGRPVTEFDRLHTRRMHLIVARRDLGDFQHLHPRMAADGTWTVPLRLDAPGTYRVFADFSHAGEATTLAADLWVPGAAETEPLPVPAAVAESAGGYEVRLDSAPVRAGEEGELSFSVSRAGRPATLQPYLGAGGHLVALREGDLAFLHVHPEARGEGEVGFAATFPSPGRYRLFLQFKVEGAVETVAFTEEVGGHGDH